MTGQSNLPHTRKPATAGILDNWYREGDSNPYTLWAQPPQGCVSTNSTTSAIQRLHHETRFTFALELEVRQSQELPTFALEAPEHHLKPAFALELPEPLDLANLLESAVQLSL